MNTEILSSLGGALAKAGAPLLRDIVVNSIGGGNSIQGKIAGTVVDALAEQLGETISGSTEKKAEAVVRRIEADPIAVAPTVKAVEEQFVKTMDMGTGSLDRYISLLELDTKQEGIIARLWRPLFALVFTFCYAVVILTICWLMWTRQWGTLAELSEITAFLTFAFIAGCAVLGVQVWKRTEEKKAGIS